LNTVRAGFVTALLASTLSCATDGAVRLARCIEHGSAQIAPSDAGPIRQPCDLALPGGSVVLAFSDDPVSTRQLEDAGLSSEEIRAVNALQVGGPRQRLNVLPSAPRIRPSRTTYHLRFVDTPRLLVRRISDGSLTVVIRREGRRLVLAAIE